MQAASYFSGNNSQTQRVNRHAIFGMRSGSLTSRYRFVQPTYRLLDIV